jgi:hypothetical protein
MRRIKRSTQIQIREIGVIIKICDSEKLESRMRRITQSTQIQIREMGVIIKICDSENKNHG